MYTNPGYVAAHTKFILYRHTSLIECIVLNCCICYSTQYSIVKLCECAEWWVLCSDEAQQIHYYIKCLVKCTIWEYNFRSFPCTRYRYQRKKPHKRFPFIPRVGSTVLFFGTVYSKISHYKSVNRYGLWMICKIQTYRTLDLLHFPYTFSVSSEANGIMLCLPLKFLEHQFLFAAVDHSLTCTF